MNDFSQVYTHVYFLPYQPFVLIETSYCLIKTHNFHSRDNPIYFVTIMGRDHNHIEQEKPNEFKTDE